MKRLTHFLAAAALAVTSMQAQDWTKARVDGKSPRHQEWVKVKQGAREVQSFITYPEVKDKATAVIVIHEIYGLTDWVRGVTDQLAEAGYIAISPDLLSGAGPNGGGTSALAANQIGPAIQALPPDQITADLNAVMDYVSKLPACNGKVVVIGFCWGGTQSFRYATNNKNIKAACPFYGSGPTKEEDLARISSPVYGFYGGNDARIGQTVPQSIELMKKLSKKYEPVTYDGAGHGFMRDGEDPNSTIPTHAANKKARDEAWTRLKGILKDI